MTQIIIRPNPEMLRYIAFPEEVSFLKLTSFVTVSMDRNIIHLPRLIEYLVYVDKIYSFYSELVKLATNKVKGLLPETILSDIVNDLASYIHGGEIEVKGVKVKVPERKGHVKLLYKVSRNMEFTEHKMLLDIVFASGILDVDELNIKLEDVFNMLDRHEVEYSFEGNTLVVNTKQLLVNTIIYAVMTPYPPRVAM